MSLYTNAKRKPSTKKRARQDTPPDVHDDEPDLYDEVLNGPLPSTSKLADDGDDGSANSSDNNNGEADEDEDDDDAALNSMPKPLQVDDLASYNSKVDQTGIIYLSRIPPGMGPSKVKHILSQYGNVGRIYLVAADSNEVNNSNAKRSSTKSNHKHRPHRFVEGWVEFLDKRIARHTADLLNARVIGEAATIKTKGSKRNGGSNKWRDDIWTMKYLPRFKWNMLSEQVAIEAATRAARLRTEIAQSKKEQAEYLRQVDRAKAHDKAVEKKRGRDERKGLVSKDGEDLPADKKAKTGGGRNFEQRQVVRKEGKGVDASLDKVLDSIF